MKKNIIITVLSLVILGFIYLLLQKPKPSNSVEYIYDSVSVFDTVYKPFERLKIVKGDRIDSLILDTVWVNSHCDSLAKEWSIERQYLDTLKNDTAALIVLQSIVRLNKLKQVSFEYKNRTPTMINNFSPDGDRFYLAAGLFSDFNSVKPLIGMSYEREKMQYNINFGKKTVFLGVGFKIK